MKQYTNGDITVIWKPELCEHVGICARGLPDVFNPRRRPWIELHHTDSATVVASEWVELSSAIHALHSHVTHNSRNPDRPSSLASAVNAARRADRKTTRVGVASVGARPSQRRVRASGPIARR